jgi:hypothetical protein
MLDPNINWDQSTRPLRLATWDARFVQRDALNLQDIDDRPGHNEPSRLSNVIARALVFFAFQLLTQPSSSPLSPKTLT